ncbi:MAG: hypothetical protein ACK6CE_15700, partial [Planctomycetota bacterium]
GRAYFRVLRSWGQLLYDLGSPNVARLSSIVGGWMRSGGAGEHLPVFWGRAYFQVLRSWGQLLYEHESASESNSPSTT